MSAKTFTLFLLLTQALVHTRVLNDSDRHQIALACLKETGVQMTIVQQAINGNIPQDNVKYKEYLACSYKKQGYQNENGKILIENVKKFLQNYYDSSDLNGLNACSGYNEPTHGENAFNALQCILKHLKSLNPKTV